MIHESIFTEVSVTGISVYGLALLFIKAFFILVLAQTLSDQFEYSSAAIRHSVWLIALASLAALPVLPLILPAWHLFSVDMASSAIAASGSLASIPFEANRALHELSTVDWLVIVYLVVVVGRLTYLAFEILKVGFVTSIAANAAGEWYEQTEGYFDGRLKIKISRALSGPVTWGTLYPVILLPEGCEHWSPLEREMVLRHELGHIRRADWLAQLLGQLVSVLYWPIPGMTKAIRSLSLEAERACDDVVLADGVMPADYAALLLRQAKINTLQATVALGKPSELAQRVRHIVNRYVDRAGERKARLWLGIAASLFLLPFASIQAIGSLPQTGLFSGMVLIPVAMTQKKPPAVEPEIRSLRILRPSRPDQVEAPPRAPDIGHSMQGVESPASLDVLPASGGILVSDIDVASYSSSKAAVLKRLQPEYPAAARRRGIEGRVVVEFDIDVEGRVVNPRITDSGSSAVFNQSVLKAINGYQYEPYRMGEQAMELQGLKEEFRFQLIENKPTKRAATGDSRAGQDPIINSG
jgi:TonB family protein